MNLEAKGVFHYRNSQPSSMCTTRTLLEITLMNSLSPSLQTQRHDLTRSASYSDIVVENTEKKEI